MSKEITRRSVLLECLDIMRENLRICSVNYEARMPKEGMEEQFDEYEQKCAVLRDLIQAYESEPVRAAIAEWQIRLMNGEKPGMEDLRRPET